jgi:hypothetical protein
MKCSNHLCPGVIPPSLRLCPACGSDNGYPNVRQARSEQGALFDRVAQAEKRARLRNCEDQLALLRDLLTKSVAVIATSPSKAHALLSDSSEAYSTFYRVVASGIRTPRPNRFDDVRGIADELLFPHYRDYISFASLSLNGIGCWYYGSVHLVLADFAIRERATAFEENSLQFCNDRRLGVHSAVPPSYRSVWGQRAELGVAKLEPALSSEHTAEDFPGIVLRRPEEFDSDFIEIHIYDRVTRDSVQKVLVRGAGTEDDEIMNKLIERDCRRSGIPFEEIK